MARLLPAAAAVSACLLLGAAAAVDGQAAALVLAVWVSALVLVGLRLSEPSSRRAASAGRLASTRRLRAARRPVLMLAELDENGGLGATRTLPVVGSEAAIAVLDARPHG